MATDRRLVVWSRPADIDLLEIWLYLSRQASDEVADAQLRKIHAVAQSLERSPFRGRRRDDLRLGLRSVLAQPYLVFYSITDTTVEIVRVLHGRRDLDAVFREDDE